MAPVAHHLDSQVDWMAHVFQAGSSAGAELRPLHHPGVQLHLAVRVEARADAGVEKRLVLHVANRRDGRHQRSIFDPRPAQLEGPLDGGLAQRAFSRRNGPGTAVDYERGGDFLSGRLEGPVHGAAFRHPPVGDE